MNKFKDMDKKKKITISVIAILILLIGSAIAIYGVSATKSDDGKAKVEKNVKLSEKEENKAKNLESEMDEKLKNAKTEEEKEAIKKEYAEKIEKATDGKVTVSSSGKVETTKPSGNNSSSSSSSGSSNSSVSKPSKPSGGSTGGSTSKPSKPTEPEKPQHTHSFSIPIKKTVTKYRVEVVTKYEVLYEPYVDAGYYEKKYFDDYDSGYDFYAWCGDNGMLANLHPVDIEEKIPYTVEEIVGYKCSCGATQ